MKNHLSISDQTHRREKILVKTLMISAALSLATLATPTLAQAQDIAAGEKLFGRCKACHTANEGGPKKVGPNLWGVFGSTAGTRDVGYKFSKAMI